MICTEEEARKKWCPEYQVAQLYNDLISNRGGFGDDARCIASSCMMWRWGKDEHGQIFLSDTKMYGYCGLGGKP